MTDVKKLSEECGQAYMNGEKFMGMDVSRVDLAFQAGFRAALECEEVRKMRTDLVVIRDFVSESHKRLLTQVIDGFDRLLEGVKA